ncbi:MAG: uracil-DNA glycosylase [Alphaproteobacteria bacterium]|nr:uracil-DNA glycosylase [Alphaproteobacteria bacterium]
MPVRLNVALQEMLSGWQGDLPAAWRALLNGTDLDFVGSDPDLTLEYWEPVFPARKGCVFPGAPKDAHIFRAFDGIDPDSVRCVLLGQDPYPEPGFSTGRAFEAGNVAQWRELDKMFSKSVRAFMQLICAARADQPNYARSFDDWPHLLADIESGAIDLEPAERVADRWEAEGVLLLNSSLTLSRFRVETDIHQSHGHMPVWKPLILRIIDYFAKAGRTVVFMAFGDVATDRLRQAGLDTTGAPNVICRPHPADAEGILSLENPFVACNRVFEAAGERPIAW